jgi:hypothetical protein
MRRSTVLSLPLQLVFPDRYCGDSDVFLICPGLVANQGFCDYFHSSSLIELQWLTLVTITYLVSLFQISIGRNLSSIWAKNEPKILIDEACTNAIKLFSSDPQSK